jgi:hypothetical protein
MFSQFAVSVDSNWWEMGIESIHVGKTCPSVKIHSTGCSWLNYAPQGQFFPATNASQDFRNTPFQDFSIFLNIGAPWGPSKDFESLFVELSLNQTGLWMALGFHERPQNY